MPPSKDNRPTGSHVFATIPEDSEVSTFQNESDARSSDASSFSKAGFYQNNHASQSNPSVSSYSSSIAGFGMIGGLIVKSVGKGIVSSYGIILLSTRLNSVQRELVEYSSTHRSAFPLRLPPSLLEELQHILDDVKGTDPFLISKAVMISKYLVKSPYMDQIEVDRLLLDFYLRISRNSTKSLSEVDEYFIRLMSVYCEKDEVRFTSKNDDDSEIHNLSWRIHQLMTTPNRLCTLEKLENLLHILSSRKFSKIVKSILKEKDRVNPFINDFLISVREWMSQKDKTHINCYLYAALAQLCDDPAIICGENSSFCILGLDDSTLCNTVQFRWQIFELPLGFEVFNVFQELRKTIYSRASFPQKSIKSLLASPIAKNLLLANGLSNELLAFLPNIKEETRWRIKKISNMYDSSAAARLLYDIGESYWERVIQYYLNGVDNSTLPYLEFAAASFIPLTADAIHIFLSEEIQSGTLSQPKNTVVSGLSSDGQLTILSPFFRDILAEMRLSKTYHGIKRLHSQLAMSCLQLMNKRLRSNILKFDDVFIQYEDMKSANLATRIKHHIGEAVQYACQYWLSHVVEMNMDDIGMIEEDIRVFFFEERHFLHWIEVMSATTQIKQAQESLLSFYNWTKGNKKIEQGLSKLVSECYHLLRCFNEPIASGPLQVYVSAIPYLPPESSLYALYKEQTTMSPKILFGQIKDIRLFSPELPPSERPLAFAFSNDESQVAFLFDTSLKIWDFATLSRISDPIALKHQYTNHDGSVVFSPDGCKIAILGSGSIEVWDLIERRLLVSQINDHVKAISFLDDAHLLYCRIQRNSLDVSEWTISENRIAAYSLQTGSTVSCVALSSEANYLGSILANKVMVWELRSREVIFTFNLGDRESKFEVLAISNDEKHVACGSDEGTVKLWNFQTGSLVWTGKTYYDDAIKQILMPLSLGSKQLVTVSVDGYVHVWDMTSGSCYKHESRAKFAALSPDGRHLVTSSWGDERVWAVEVNKDEAILLPEEVLQEVVFLNDGSPIAWGQGVKKDDIVVWDKLGTASASRQTLEGHTYWFRGLRFSLDGKRLVRWDRDGNIILWSRDGDDVRFSVRERLKFDREVHLWNSDAVPLTSGGILVAGSKFEEKEIIVWDNFGSQNEQKQVLRCEERVWNVKLSLDGRRLVSSDFNNVFLWCRGSYDVTFKLHEKRACGDWPNCYEYFKQLAYWQSEDTPEDLQSPASQTQADGNKYNMGDGLKKGPFVTFDAKTRWVHFVDGRKLWYIPECFMENEYELRFAQRGQKIVVYSPRFANLFEYKGDFVGTLLK